ncbi:Uncharacterised protein [Achromobacter sp. 2789STDY5608633]|nr:Uncharacterised protein [Achromobacter sp. 2789STDY5608633]CUJ45598.1 Uncharacterised protein [Achromobacter sp. 2789STDY5608621]CUK24212.1 Uncharacterised protein [Achromobacter sp. 2789STDY5608615]
MSAFSSAAVSGCTPCWIKAPYESSTSLRDSAASAGLGKVLK